MAHTERTQLGATRLFSDKAVLGIFESSSNYVSILLRQQQNLAKNDYKHMLVSINKIEHTNIFSYGNKYIEMFSRCHRNKERG